MGKITMPAGRTTPATMMSLVEITLAVRRQVMKSPASTRKRHVIARLGASTSPRYYTTGEPGAGAAAPGAGMTASAVWWSGERRDARGRASQRRHRFHH